MVAGQKKGLRRRSPEKNTVTIACFMDRANPSVGSGVRNQYMGGTRLTTFSITPGSEAVNAGMVMGAEIRVSS
jgi:hypothetical protein